MKASGWPRIKGPIPGGFVILALLWTVGLSPRAALALDCGSGKTARELSTAIGTEVWCESDGTREGVYELRSAKGQILRRGVYEDDLPEGEFETWYEGGKRRSRGEYRKGKMRGHWTRWHASGQVMDRIYFGETGAEGPYELRSEKGALVESGVFEDGARKPGAKPGFWWAPFSYARWMGFRASGLALYYGGARLFTTGGVAWNPRFAFSERWEGGLSLGGALLRDSVSRAYFPVVAALLAGAVFPLRALGLEARAGAGYWARVGFLGGEAGFALVFRPWPALRAGAGARIYFGLPRFAWAPEGWLEVVL